MTPPRTVTVYPGFTLQLSPDVLPPTMVRRVDGLIASIGGAMVGLLVLAAYLAR